MYNFNMKAIGGGAIHCIVKLCWKSLHRKLQFHRNGFETVSNFPTIDPPSQPFKIR